MNETAFQIVERFIATNNRIPPAKYVSSMTGCSLEEADDAILSISKRYEAKTVPKAKVEIDKVDEVKKVVSKFRDYKFQIKWFSRIGMLFSLVWSVFYVHDSLSRFDPSPLSLIGAVILVIAGYNFFQVAIVSYKDKKWGIFSIFAVCSLVTLITLMSCTFMGIYEKRTTQIEKVSIIQVGFLKDKKSYDNNIFYIEKCMVDIADEKKSKDVYVSNFKKIVDDGFKPGSVEYNRANTKISNSDDRLSELNTKIESLKSENVKLSSVNDFNTKERETFFSALARSWGGTANDWEFRFNIIVAFVIDAVGPLAMAISIFI